MADIDLKTETPDTTLPTTGFLFGADSQAAASPSVFTVQSVATTLLGSTTLTGATVTTSSPVIDAAQTWNASGVTFTGLKFNATDTASSALSAALEIQYGGSTYARIGKGAAGFSMLWLLGSGGTPTSANSVLASSGNLLYVNAPSTGTGSVALGDANGVPFLVSGGNNTVRMSSGTTFGFIATASTPTTAIDTILTRRGAANLRLGAADAAAPVAQTLSVQSVVAGTTNKAGEPLTITGSQGTGTGAGGSIIFQVAPAGSTGTAQNALATALTINSAGNALFSSSGTVSSNTIGIGAANTGIYSTGASIVDVALGGSRVFSFQADVMYLLSNTGRIAYGSSSDAFFRRTGTGAFAIGSNASNSTGTLALGVASVTPAATLPATPTAGMIVAVNTATAPVIGSVLTLGGAAYALAFYNNAQWTVIGN